jgi:Abnormal spindle-like microcephaly-assoc'd, ASPM-SPD-2-Hydin
VARTFTVTNTSATPEPLVLGSATLHGAGFTLAADGCSGRTVAPGDTCTLAVTFSPAITGAATGTVSLPSNAAGSPATIALSATGTAPVPPPAPPVLKVTHLSATHCLGTVAGAHRSITIGYTVSAASRVTFTLQHRVKPGSGIRSTCPKPFPAGTPGDYVTVRRPAVRRARASVAVAKTQPLSKTVSVTVGPHTFALKTLLGATKLVPGRYRVLVQAVSTRGAKAQNAAYFWVLKPPKR